MLDLPETLLNAKDCVECQFAVYLLMAMTLMNSMKLVIPLRLIVLVNSHQR